MSHKHIEDIFLCQTMVQSIKSEVQMGPKHYFRHCDACSVEDLFSSSVANYCTLLFAIFNILTEDAQKVVFYLSLEDYNGMLLTINSSNHYHSKFTCWLHRFR